MTYGKKILHGNFVFPSAKGFVSIPIIPVVVSLFNSKATAFTHIQTLPPKQEMSVQYFLSGSCLLINNVLLTVYV